MIPKAPLRHFDALPPLARALRSTRIAALCFGLAAAASAVTPPPPSNAWIRPAEAAGASNGYDLEHEAFVFEGAPLRQVIAAAWGAHERDVHFREGIDGDALYQAYARPPRTARGLPFARAQAQLRAQIRRTLALEVRTEEVEGPVQVLRRISASAWQLSESTSEQTRIETGAGLFRGRRASMTAFVRFIRSYASEPVVDETGLSGVYDFVLEWDPRADQRALLDAFGDIGLSLESGVRSHKRLVVEGKATP